MAGPITQVSMTDDMPNNALCHMHRLLLDVSTLNMVPYLSKLTPIAFPNLNYRLFPAMAYGWEWDNRPNPNSVMQSK